MRVDFFGFRKTINIMWLFLGLTRFGKSNKKTVLNKHRVGIHCILYILFEFSVCVAQAQFNLKPGYKFFHRKNNEVNKTKVYDIKKYNYNMYRYDFNSFHIFVDIFTYVYDILFSAENMLLTEKITN